MKIEQAEIDAAIVAYNGSALTPVGRKQLNGMERALEAAYRVRKARKKARKAAQNAAPITDEDKAWAERELRADALRKLGSAIAREFPEAKP